MKLTAIFVLCIFATSAFAGSWECKNQLEIVCSSGNCQAAPDGEFTPMSVSFDDSGKISVCAYSGCWEGAGRVFQTGDFLSLHASDLKFSTSDSMADIAITLDRSDRIAVLKVAEFAQPLVCSESVGQNADETAFIPAGWRLEDRVTGDLNGDSLADSVLQVIKTDSEDEDYNRSLIILFKTMDGGFTKAAEAKKIIRCSICGGMLGGGPADIKIEKGVLTISQMYGSREASDYLNRFRFDPALGKFVMIGEDVTNFDRATGNSETTSTNLLTGKQIVSKTIRDENSGRETTTNRAMTVKKIKRFIEDVDYANY